MKRIVLFLFVLLMFGWSCTKKKYPESVSENAPVFYFKALVNNVPVEYKAGINNYRMFSSFQQDSNKIYNLIAELKPIDCNSNCSNSFKIQINDYKVSAVGSAIRIDSTLKLGNYNFLKDLSGSTYTVAFTSVQNKPAANYRWDFGDGTFSNAANPIHVFKQAGVYQICLQVSTSDGYANSICNSIKVGLNQPLNAYINTPTVLGDTLSLSATVLGGRVPYSYHWDFGDGTFSQTSNPVHHYAISGSYPVKLKIRDNNNEVLQVNYNAVTEKDKSSFAVNFKSDILQIQRSVVEPSNIILSYTNENGEVFSSINQNQPGNSNFEILEVANYDVNENNEPTKKIKIKFNCMVYNGAQALKIENAETIIAVSYK